MYEQSIHGLHPTFETEEPIEFDYTIGTEIPYCEHWQTVWQISDGYEPLVVLGYQRGTLQNTMGFSSVFPIGEGAQGVDAGDWWLWYS